MLASSLVLVSVPTTPRVTAPYPPQFGSAEVFSKAFSTASSTLAVTSTVTGLIVPHHLLAADVIARAFSSSRSAQPAVVLVLFPDHFNLGDRDITVSQRGFNTVFGEVAPDGVRVAQLLKQGVAGEGNWFYREHGIGAEVQFIKRYFPGAKLIAVSLKESSREPELNALVVALKKILPKNTLVVQSTDFSHYLPKEAAEKEDAKTRPLLLTGNAAQLLKLEQPSQIDSSAAMYVQARLQEEFFGSKIRILEHANSQDFTREYVEKTTSYFTAQYER